MSHTRMWTTTFRGTSIASYWGGTSQINAFRSGFYYILGGRALELFQAEELKTLVVGIDELDFSALEANASYEGRYDANHPTVRAFWKCVSGMSRDEQIEFLRFTTGCSRAPLGGLGKLNFKLQRSGPDGEALPTAHTCFNTLLLPDYSTFDKLKRKLLIAIHQYEGFGLE